MADQQKPLQAMFDIDDTEAEVIEGVGFEPGHRYTFTIEKAPVGKYMQYGAAKGGLYVLSKKCPDDLAAQYQKHPDQFEIFSAGEVNGIQALVPGRDFDKFRPFLSRTLSVAWVYTNENGAKRIIYMQLNVDEKVSVNPGHPEWESRNIRIARKMGIDIPAPGSKEKFSLSFLHPGLTISAEVVMNRRKNDTKDRPELDLETIEPATAAEAGSSPQRTIEDDLDPEIRANIIEHADGCKSVAEVIKKVRVFLKNEKITDPAVLGKYTSAITKMKERKEICV